MKKMIVLVGFVLLSVSAQAEVIVTPMLDFTPTEMGLVFDIKTTKFKNVTLDCQSFITGIKFEEQGGEVHDFYLDMFQCEEAFTFFTESKRDNLPVCLGVDKDNNELLVTHAEEVDCK